jgi:SWI/SNF-related matrix-associated actin-dependent regulator 1 of chromatin subfamily A
VKLDFNPSNSTYILRVPRAEFPDVKVFTVDHGLDFSIPASSPQEAVFFTREPYAAVTFMPHATNMAAIQLSRLSGAIDTSWKLDSKANIKVPAGRELWGFQKANVEYALQRTHTLIGDQPGLGKTPTAIAFANEINAKRVLVICPASIRLQWVRRIREWTTMSYPFTVYPVLNGRNGVHPTAQWTVVSYELARSPEIGRALARGMYDVMILDEAHYLKTPTSRRTRAIFGGGENPPFEHLSSRVGSILALTGTPLPNRPREAYTLLRGMAWDAIDWMSEDRFRERFNPSVRGVNPITGAMFVDERTGRHAELQNRLRANIMCRHLKKDVMPQLDLPVYDLIQLEETTAVRQALEAERLLDIDPDDLSGADVPIMGDVSTVRRMMGIALAPQVADYIDMLIDGGEEKLVVFAWHHEVLDILMKKLARHKPLRIDGNTSAVRKERYVQDFIDLPEHQVIIGNMLAMGTGVDGLQHVAWHALIAEPDWVPGNNEQAFDRLNRGGQKRKVQGDIFVAPGSFAERILASALRKMQTIDKALDRRF